MSDSFIADVYRDCLRAWASAYRQEVPMSLLPTRLARNT